MLRTHSRYCRSCIGTCPARGAPETHMDTEIITSGKKYRLMAILNRCEIHSAEQLGKTLGTLI